MPSTVHRFKILGTAIFILFLSMVSLNANSPASSSHPITSTEAEAIATEAYIYAYPLITMDLTREVTTNTVKVDGFKAPLGQLVSLRTYPTPAFKDVTAPNADTLYTVGFVDVAKEPYVLHVPEENGRYYLMPMLSAWTDVFADPGTRTTGTKAGDFAIAGPGWKGSLPAGVKEYKSPTNLVWILGRTYCTGTPEDYALVHAIQDQYTLKPLSAYGKPYTPPNGKFDPKIDIKTPVRDQVNQLEGIAYFTRFAKLLKNNPPQKEDAPIIDKLARIGIIPGQDLDLSQLPPAVVEALRKAPQKGLEMIAAQEKKSGKTLNGWNLVNPTGRYGTDYLQRAFVAAFGLGANLPQDAIYPSTNVDQKGQQLSGENKYRLHFAKGQVPPVKGFWSLTMYNDQYFFVENPINRYTLSQRDQLKYNTDGSLDLYIQNESPGSDWEANWLPAPKNAFVLMFRFYWPEDSLLKGEWKPPAVTLVE